MISFRLCFILTALIGISVPAESANLRKHRNTSLRGKSQKELDCVMFLTETNLSDGQEEEEWVCEDDQGQFVELDRQYDAEYTDPEAGPLKSGSTILHSDDAFFVSKSKVIIREPKFTQLPKKHHRHTLETIEKRSVLMVRIEANDSKPTLTESDLASKVFGIGDEDSFNLSSAFDQCSYGKMKMEPTQIFADGIHTLKIDQNIIGEKNTDIRTIALEQLREEMGTTDLNGMFDHVALCLPPGTTSKQGNNNWSAYGIINGYVTLYNDKWCTSTSALMHEIGHNLGLRHSNEMGEYKDMSGMMGHSFLGSGLPKMCYNTAKNWQLNWFEDKHETVNPLNENFWEGDLIGYSDYQNPKASSESKVILKIEGHEKDFFVGFNRKAGINIQNQEAGAENKVTVHSTSTSGESEIEAKLNIGEMFEIPLFGQTDQSVLIQVENIDMSTNPAVARVSVTYMKCVSDADCDDGSSCTTDTCNLTSGKCIHTPNDLCSDFMEMILHTDQYPTETSWSIIDNCKDDDDVVMSGNGYKKTFSTYEKSINVPPSQYTLKIYDSYGDGICCGQGDGHFTVKVNNENVLEGGKFGSSLEHTWGSCNKVETAAPTPSPTVTPTEAPSSSPTACEMSYELTFRVRTYSHPSAAPTSWKFSYDEDLSIVGKSSAGMMYHSGVSYTESGCLKSNCYHFDVSDVESYSLVIDGEELASGTDIYEPEKSLFGTCQSIS